MFLGKGDAGERAEPLNVTKNYNKISSFFNTP